MRIHFALCDPATIFGMVGRCGGGYNTVWSDWSSRGRKARASIIKEFEKGMNDICGHYTLLESSMLEHGCRDPLVITAGPPVKRSVANLPPEMRSTNPRKWLLLEGVTGGSRLWVAQKHHLPVPCIINDYYNLLSGFERITTVDSAVAKFSTPPAFAKITPRGFEEPVDPVKNGSHLGPEWSEDKIVEQRAILWVSLMNQHGYRVNRLSHNINALLENAGIVQPTPAQLAQSQQKVTCERM